MKEDREIAVMGEKHAVLQVVRGSVVLCASSRQRGRRGWALPLRCILMVLLQLPVA